MGKGAGKLHAWYTSLHPGMTVVGSRTYWRGRAAYYTKQVKHKFSIRTRFIEHLH